MGKNALGGPHYSGMGLAWKTKFALRMFLENAYLNDANAAFLATKRAGKAPADPINIIEDSQTQVRFSASQHHSKSAHIASSRTARSG